jgi:hypothetical protein
MYAPWGQCNPRHEPKPNCLVLSGVSPGQEGLQKGRATCTASCWLDPPRPPMPRCTTLSGAGEVWNFIAYLLAGNLLQPMTKDGDNLILAVVITIPFLPVRAVCASLHTRLLIFLEEGGEVLMVVARDVPPALRSAWNGRNCVAAELTRPASSSL